MVKRPATKASPSLVEACLKAVPRGERLTAEELAVMTYGHSGQGALIQVRKELKRMSTTMPWWRVVGKGGLQKGRERAQRKRLLEEVSRDMLEKPLHRDPEHLPAFLADAYADVLIEGKNHEFTLIYLPGRGFTGRYYAQNRSFFQVKGQDGLRVVVPTPPLNAELVTEWFSEPEEEVLKVRRQTLDRIIEEEVKKLGDSERVFLGGSSQGCVLGLDAYLRCPFVLGGFCGIVGFFARCSQTALQQMHGKESKPVYLLNGTADTVVPWTMARESYQALTSAGLEHLQIHEKDKGHSFGKDEGIWIQGFLKEAVFA